MRSVALRQASAESFDNLLLVTLITQGQALTIPDVIFISLHLGASSENSEHYHHKSIPGCCQVKLR